jgi:hypothetical protein
MTRCIFRCRSTHFGRRCMRRVWHRGWHQWGKGLRLEMWLG